jgi:ribonuclease HI
VKSDNDIFITSDGGVYEYQGTFGVVISDKATPTLTNYGKLYSPELYESSYRSEAYGMLAGIISLNQAMETTEAHLKKGKTFVLYCDNKTLVKRVNDRLTNRIKVNQHCDADIDLELQILSEIRKLPPDFLISIRHVKGYKLKKKNNELSSETQMHIMADNLSKQARQCRPQMKYYKFPANAVNLVVKNQTINANVPKASTIAYHSMVLHEYLQEKYKWSNYDIGKIWWKVHQKSIS